MSNMDMNLKGNVCESDKLSDCLNSVTASSLIVRRTLCSDISTTCGPHSTHFRPPRQLLCYKGLNVGQVKFHMCRLLCVVSHSVTQKDET